MKIGLIVFSSNRLQYLEPVLDSLTLLDFEGFDVYKILIDDFPKNRDDEKLLILASKHGFREIILNKETQGYDNNIKKAWERCQELNVDFIWHQEDDYRITKPISIRSLIDIISITQKQIVSVVLRREPWYPFEKERETIFGPHWIFKNNNHSDRAFTTIQHQNETLYLNTLNGFNWFYFMPTLYKIEVTKIPFEHDYLPQEGTISYACFRSFGECYQAFYETDLSEYHCEHIGEISHGLKTSKGMPGYEYTNPWGGGTPDPESDFNSRTPRRTWKAETSLIVIDEFYNNPEDTRKFALSQPFDIKGNYPGLRTKSFAWQSVHDAIEKIIVPSSGKIIEWPTEETAYNGSFQLATAKDRSWIHVDQHNNWAGVLFLTPNAPLSSGTRIYQHKSSGLYTRSPNQEIEKQVNADSQDLSRWEIVDQIGNKFNRLVLFRSNRYHMSGEYFGFTMEDGRLFQVFFFNTEF